MGNEIKDEGEWIFLAASMDVRYWRLLHDEACPYCKIEWEDLPAEANIIPHWHAQCKKAVEEVRKSEDEKFLRAVGIAV